MSKRMPTLLRWIEAHEVQRKSEQAILARRETEWETRARHAKTPASEPAAPMHGIRSRLVQIRGALLARRPRTA